jgi:hypothetical protein
MLATETNVLQKVAGFEEIVSGCPLHELADHIGSVDGWINYCWWESGTKPRTPELIWKSAPCPEKASTILECVVSMAHYPFNSEEPCPVQLSINGKYAITFTLGWPTTKNFDANGVLRWQEGDVRLEFSARRLASNIEGFPRVFTLRGISGVLRVELPERLITPGESLQLAVEMAQLVGDQPIWFAIHNRTQVESDESQLAKEMQTLQVDHMWLKERLNTLAQKLYPELFPDPLHAEHVMIYQDGMRWVGVADVQKLKNGDLMVSFREAMEHTSNDGRICTVRSSDNGRTWKNLQVIAEDVGIDHRDPSVTVLSNGTLLLTWWPNLRRDQETGVRLKDRNPPVHGRDPIKMHIAYSYDNGYTWTKAATIEPDPFLWIETCEPCIELPNGRILFPIYAETKERRLASVVFASDDHGVTWRYLSTILERPEDKTLAMDFQETSLVVTGSGDVIAIVRTQDEGMWQARSTDWGESWQDLHRVPQLPSGTQPSLMRAQDGRLLLSYGHRGTAPRRLCVRISNDEGRSWEPPLTLRADFPNLDMGYPSTIELAPGYMYTVYWHNLFDRFFLAGTYWHLPAK